MNMGVMCIETEMDYVNEIILNEANNLNTEIKNLMIQEKRLQGLSAREGLVSLFNGINFQGDNSNSYPYYHLVNRSLEVYKFTDYLWYLDRQMEEKLKMQKVVCESLEYKKLMAEANQAQEEIDNYDNEIREKEDKINNLLNEIDNIRLAGASKNDKEN